MRSPGPRQRSTRRWRICLAPRDYPLWALILFKPAPDVFDSILHLTVSGFKPEIDIQDWIISRAEYVIGDNGLTTKMELEAKISDLLEREAILVNVVDMWTLFK